MKQSGEAEWPTVRGVPAFAMCGVCGAAVQDVGGRLDHAEPWCSSWTYHASVGDYLPVKWRDNIPDSGSN